MNAVGALDIVGAVLLLLGAALVLLAGIGLLRFPDVLTRASSGSKATGLGLTLVIVGVALVLATPRALVVLGLAALAQLVTAPVAGHVIARAAYRSGAPLWEGTHTDELAAHYATHPDEDA
ncbi:MAG: hypothetical protein RLZZ272_856 [Actinomycetota bacterium]|jgi:multicomponent Na+:H+ antiporter subunit G